MSSLAVASDAALCVAQSSPSTTESKPTPPSTLLPEIWALVIPHLRRKMPSGGSIRNPNDYHQADLATVMRVSKMLYDIAAPILYERVIVSDLPRFFHGVPSLKPRVNNDYDIPKVKLFRHIKRLDLAYTSVYTKQWSAQRESNTNTNPNTGSCGIIGSPAYGDSLPAQFLDILDLPREMIAPLTNDINMAAEVSGDPLLSWSMDSRAPPLFPNLRQITVGAFGERHWDTHEPKFNKLKFTDTSHLAREDDLAGKQALEDAKLKLHQVFQNRFFGRFLANNCSPDHVCSHVSTGPFTYLHNNHFPNEPLLICDRTPPAKTYTTHLLEQINKGSWLHVVEGGNSINRWVVDEVFWDVPVADQALVFNFFKGQFATRKSVAEMINFDRETRIQIYNLINPKMLEDVMPIIAVLAETEREELEKDRKKLKEVMLAFLGVTDEVAAQVELMDEDPGVCPACGEGSG
ncbi:hypothetical protein I317_01363 [Kwoniella heveanensis CBS 569]|nr:hypothetical protein I317_01363 [Kwoniella heveanensis CBS 569]